MRQKACILWTCVHKDVRGLVERLAESMGLTVSEYLRQLVIDDLDRRTVFTTRLKEALMPESRRMEGR